MRKFLRIMGEITIRQPQDESRSCVRRVKHKAWLCDIAGNADEVKRDLWRYVFGIDLRAAW